MGLPRRFDHPPSLGQQPTDGLTQHSTWSRVRCRWLHMPCIVCVRASPHTSRSCSDVYTCRRRHTSTNPFILSCLYPHSDSARKQATHKFIFSSHHRHELGTFESGSRRFSFVFTSTHHIYLPNTPHVFSFSLSCSDLFWHGLLQNTLARTRLPTEVLSLPSFDVLPFGLSFLICRFGSCSLLIRSCWSGKSCI